MGKAFSDYEKRSESTWSKAFEVAKSPPARACYGKWEVEREEGREVLANSVDGLMSEKRELNLLNVPEFPRASPRRKRRVTAHYTRRTVVVALIVTGIIALLGTGIIAYWPISDRLRVATPSARPLLRSRPRCRDRKSPSHISTGTLGFGTALFCCSACRSLSRHVQRWRTLCGQACRLCSATPSRFASVLEIRCARAVYGAREVNPRRFHPMERCVASAVAGYRRSPG